MFKSHQPYLPSDSEMVLGASEKGAWWWDKLPKCDEKIGGGMEEVRSREERSDELGMQ